MQHHSVERCAVVFFAKKIVFRAVFVKKSWIFWIFLKPIGHSWLPYAFLKFNALCVQKYSEDLFAYCLAALAETS